ncbi:acylphosphatase, partial [Virgibacillus alimentarius]|uniref:acylphosphatase n=1 Tax=Virgibacillus alimentarius TaxID=698769 RepID=UPI000492EC3A
MEKKEWLSHIESSIPEEARGYTVSMYSIALEGWRRGLKLKFINENRRKSELLYSLSSKEKEHKFVVSRGDLTSGKALKICRDKHLTKKYLKEADVSTPKGELFPKNISNKKIIKYANQLGFPLVLKPSNGTGGAGVIANIKNEKEFSGALNYVRYELNYPDVIVETYFSGVDHRVYVVGDKVVGAFIRIPANVIGDGKNTVNQLLKLKMKERDKNPALFKRPIKIDKEMHNMLRSQGYALDSIPKKGERIYLKSKNNVSSGGDPIDVTDHLSKEIKDIAVKAKQAIPGLAHCGLDIIVNKEENTGVVLEINTQASIRSHLFPMEGKARDIPKEIIDYYFPETAIKNKRPLYFFDFKNIYDSFRRGLAKEYVVPEMPSTDVTSTRFEVSGELRGVNYEKWIFKQARNLKLNGYIKHLTNNKTSVVISGSKKSVEKFREIINNKASKRAKVTSVVEKNRTTPVKIGFEIMDNLNVTSKSDTLNLQETQKEPSVLNEGYFPVRLKDMPSKIKQKNKK